MSGSADRFGYQWQRYPELRQAHEEQFRRWLPFLTPEAWRGKTFLDVGCGMGRNSYWPMTYGAAGGLAIDVDTRTLSAARQTLDGFPEVQVEHRSVYDLGEAHQGRFDVVFSIGVVHHLEDPARALRAMTAAAKPGGLVCVWVYGRENNGWLLHTVDPLRRHLLRRLPIRAVHALSLPPSLALWAMLRAHLGRGAYLELLRDFSLRQLRAIVFDQLNPRIARYYRREQVEGLLRQAQLRELRLEWVNQISWAAAGTRASAER